MRHVVIGDIHGCHAELMALLDAVSPSTDDRIVAIGDIVDRGPDSGGVLEFFRDHPNAMSIMGNHERKHVRSARGEIRPALAQEIVRQELGEDYEKWLGFMAGFPRHLELPEAILVHGFMEPGVPLEEQKDAVVIGTLSGEEHMARHYPEPWYDHYAGPKPIVVGHHSYLGNGEPVIREGHVYGIDTGCCHGGRLTALVLPEFRVVSVPSRGDHWSEQRRRYALLAGSGRSAIDLDWEVLAAFGQAITNPNLSARLLDEARRYDELWKSCRQLVSEVLAAVATEHTRIVARLQQVEDWQFCSERKRDARYARVVGNHGAAPFLFAVRRGTLDETQVLRMCKTPRELAERAQALDIQVPWSELTLDDVRVRS